MKLLFNTNDVMEILSVDVQCFKWLLRTKTLICPITFKDKVGPEDVMLWRLSDLEDCVDRLTRERDKELKRGRSKKNGGNN